MSEILATREEIDKEAAISELKEKRKEKRKENKGKIEIFATVQEIEKDTAIL